MLSRELVWISIGDWIAFAWECFPDEVRRYRDRRDGTFDELAKLIPRLHELTKQRTHGRIPDPAAYFREGGGHYEVERAL